jgi:hypothetical protein
VGSFGATATALDTSVYLKPHAVTDADWCRFAAHAKREVRTLLNSLEESHPALFGDFASSPTSDANKIRRGETLLDLILYEDSRLTAEAVSILHRQFNRRIELSTLVTVGSSLVLDGSDSRTVAFVRNRKAALSRAFTAFGDPDAPSLRLCPGETVRLTQRIATRSLASPVIDRKSTLCKPGSGLCKCRGACRGLAGEDCGTRGAGEAGDA